MANLKFSVADWCFLGGEDPLDYYKKLKASGFDTAETVPPSRFAAARQAGVRVLNTDGPGKADGVNRRENHRWLLPKIAESIGLAAEAGIPHLIVFSGERKGQTVKEGMENCAAAFTLLAAEAEKRGVVMVMELISNVEIPDYLAVSSAFGFELARRVGSPAFKVLYDAHHMQVMGEDVASDIAEHLDAIGHIHLSQAPGMISPLRSGPLDFKAVISRAHHAGYAGHWGLEFHPAGDTAEELIKARDLLNSYIR
jgi:hydroxypyruvate isomerase